MATQLTLDALDQDPHPVLAALRAGHGPVAWAEPLNAWLVTGYAQAVQVLRDPRTYTVADPRFSTARVVGPSMLSLDGAEHARHRAPFTGPFRADAIQERLTAFTEAQAGRLVAAIAADGAAELRRAVAGPLAVAVITEALSLHSEPGGAAREPDGPGGLAADAATVLRWYDGIVAAVQEAATAPGEGRIPSAAFSDLARSLSGRTLPGITPAEYTSNVAVLMFGAIETTEGMITNALFHLLSTATRPAAQAIEESLRLEPAAAVVDRYATADTEIAGARVRKGDQVTVSISGANRDPAVFPGPDRFDPRRHNAHRHLTFAHGPHFCLGAHLARLETRIAVDAIYAGLPGLRLDGTPRPRGLVFRKPPELRVTWARP